MPRWLELVKGHITEVTTTVTMLIGFAIGITGASPTTLPQTTSILLVVVSCILLLGKWWPRISKPAELKLIRPESAPLSGLSRFFDPFRKTSRVPYNLSLRNRRIEGTFLLIVALGTTAFSGLRIPGVVAEVFPSSDKSVAVKGCRGDGSKDSMKVMIADFDEQATSTDFEDNLYALLASRSQWIGKIRVCRTSKVIGDSIGAIELGQKSKAAVVIWGRSNESLYEVNVEIAEWDMPEYEWRPFPTEDAKTAAFQTNEPLRTMFYTEYILSSLMYMRGNTDSARDLLLNALAPEEVTKLKANPNNSLDLAKAYFLLGFYYDLSASPNPDLDMAIEYYSKAIETDKTFYPAYLNRGKAYQRTKQNDLALEDCKAAANAVKDTRPDLAAAALSNAALLLAETDAAQANEFFQQAIALDPVKGYTQRGLTRLFTWKQPDQAVTDFLEALKRDKTDPYLYHFLGEAQLINNQLDDAVQTYKKAVSTARWEPGDKDALVYDLQDLEDVYPPTTQTVNQIIEMLNSADLP